MTAAHRHRFYGPAAAWIATLSDSRNNRTDTGGAAIGTLLEAAGHKVLGTSILREDEDTLIAGLTALLDDPAIDVVLCTGGTGIAPRDRTHDVLQTLYEKTIPGFGELFSMLSWQEIGSAAMASRASAGIARGKLIFAMPGSPAAIDLAMTRLVLPELGHLLGELRRTDHPEEPR